MKIAANHVDALVQLGYTQEEARFIYIVAIHSGYFTHRQFLHFSETKPGKHSQKFIAKLLAQKCATSHTYRCGGRVYHIFSRRVFNAIGRDNLRTRRKHQLDYIKTRLMALDFVLSNPHHHYLETEAEKVPFFEGRMQVSRSVLPVKTYTSKVTGKATARYFVDRFPVYIQDATSFSPVVTFVYLDPGFATLKGFVTHLWDYASLFRSLPQFEMMYVATSDRFFNAARSEFSRVLHGGVSGRSRENLVRYLALRKAWEAGDRVEAADVVFLNAAKIEFRGEAFESVYRKWSQRVADEADFRACLGLPVREVQGSISMLKGGDSLSVFRQANEEFTQLRSENLEGRVSPVFSPEVSHP